MQQLSWLRTPRAGETVRVYRNLRRGCWTIQARVNLPLTGRFAWRVIAHAADVVLTQARFTVNEAGRQQVLRERRKNVHAFITGVLVRADRPAHARETRAFVTPVTYNPYRAGAFHDPSVFPVVPITRAARVWLPDGSSRAWAVL
jgi:hypothetical protein